MCRTKKAVAFLLLFFAIMLSLITTQLNAKENECGEWQRLIEKKERVRKEIANKEDGYLKSFKIWQYKFLTDYFISHQEEIISCKLSMKKRKK